MIEYIWQLHSSKYITFNIWPLTQRVGMRALRPLLPGAAGQGEAAVVMAVVVVMVVVVMAVVVVMVKKGV